MSNNIKYGFLVVLITFCSISKGQFFCDYEYKVINKQKQKIKRKCKSYSKAWVKEYRDSLKIPSKINISRLKYSPIEDEYKNMYNDKWGIIDTLLCNNERKENNVKAMNELENRKTTVYELIISFTEEEADNPKIKSSLHFQFNIYGKVLRIAYRLKRLSKTSEIFFH
ncbi:MAG: hypothetical protein P1U41_07325 [Vicingaceae bacterium]|nr:hypothetical protein [Vicingaceae bacterium]